MASVFLWTPETEARVREVRAHAERSENWYRLGGPLPRNDPAFIIQVGTTQAVFTWSVVMFGVLRHLAVSTKGGAILPRVVYTLAHHLGFTGATPDDKGFVEQPGPWQSKFSRIENCAVLQELVQPDPVDLDVLH